MLGSTCTNTASFEGLPVSIMRMFGGPLINLDGQRTAAQVSTNYNLQVWCTWRFKGGCLNGSQAVQKLNY